MYRPAAPAPSPPTGSYARHLAEQQARLERLRQEERHRAAFEQAAVASFDSLKLKRNSPTTGGYGGANSIGADQAPSNLSRPQSARRRWILAAGLTALGTQLLVIILWLLLTS